MCVRGESLVLSLSVKTFCFRAGNPNSDSPAPAPAPAPVATCCRRCRSVSPALDRRCSQVHVSCGCAAVLWASCDCVFGYMCATSLSVVGLSLRLMLLAAVQTPDPRSRHSKLKLAPGPGLQLMQYSYYLACPVCSILFYLIWFWFGSVCCALGFVYWPNMQLLLLLLLQQFVLPFSCLSAGMCVSVCLLFALRLAARFVCLFVHPLFTPFVIVLFNVIASTQQQLQQLRQQH